MAFHTAHVFQHLASSDSSEHVLYVMNRYIPLLLIKMKQVFLNQLSCFTSWHIPIIKLQCIRRVWRYQRGDQNSLNKKDRQYNDQNKKDKRTNNDLQNTTQKTKDRATRTKLKTGSKPRCSGRVASCCSTNIRQVYWLLCNVKSSAVFMTYQSCR